MNLMSICRQNVCDALATAMITLVICVVVLGGSSAAIGQLCLWAVTGRDEDEFI